MKKLAFVFAAIVAVSFASCGNKTTGNECTDSTACVADTTACCEDTTKCGNDTLDCCKDTTVCGKDTAACVKAA